MDQWLKLLVTKWVCFLLGWVRARFLYRANPSMSPHFFGIQPNCAFPRFQRRRHHLWLRALLPQRLWRLDFALQSWCRSEGFHVNAVGCLSIYVKCTWVMLYIHIYFLDMQGYQKTIGHRGLISVDISHHQWMSLIINIYIYI